MLKQRSKHNKTQPQALPQYGSSWGLLFQVHGQEADKSFAEIKLYSGNHLSSAA